MGARRSARLFAPDLFFKLTAILPGGVSRRPCCELVKLSEGNKKMPKRTILISAAGMVALSIACMGENAAYAQVQKPAKTGVSTSANAETRISLNGDWQFAFAADEQGVEKLAQFYRPGADVSVFRSTPVPSNWVMQGYEEPHYKPFKDGEKAGEGFYIKRFTLPKGWPDNRILLHFDGVWSSAEIWLNGKPLGRYDTGFTPLVTDISSHLSATGKNILSVRVRQKHHDYLFDTNDDWTLGGIYRDVWLEAMPKDRWIDRVDVETDLDDEYRDADLKMRIMIGDNRNRSTPYPGNVGYTLKASLLDADGKIVEVKEIAVLPHQGTGRETRTAMRLQKPRQWTAETPNLYRLRVEMLEGATVTHVREVNVGVREVSTVGGVFRINGQAVKLRGVNRHDEHPDVGRATRKEHWLQDIQLIKAANINYVRLAHYPPAKGFLDLCDQLGLYVSDEVSMGGGGDHMNDPSFAAAAMVRSYETVARDINHPSIIIWTIGNEDPLTSMHLASIRTVKGLDPTRPVLMPWRAEDWIPPEIDILAPHYPTARKLDEITGRASRPVLTTEYSHAYGTEGMGGLEERWKMLANSATGAGGAIWLWADQGLTIRQRQADGRETSSLKLTMDGFDGITDAYRQPTRDYWETKAVYSPVFPTVESISATVGQASVDIPIMNAFDFTDLSAVTLDWSLMQDDIALAQGSATLKGLAHAQSSFTLPMDKLGRLEPGATYYAQLAFKRADGTEITRRSVEIAFNDNSAPAATALSAPQVNDGQTVEVRAGKASYLFDPRTGMMTAASAQGKPLLTDLRPSLWRPLTENERVAYIKDHAEQWPDLSSLRATAKKWEVVKSKDSVTIHADVDHVVDGKNSVAARYDYMVAADGKLTVHYSFQPHVEAKWLPWLGMSGRLRPDGKTVRWLGLGPLDAFPNEKAASYLGLWSQSLSDGGTKKVRWIDLPAADAETARIFNDGYMAFEKAQPDRLHILAKVRQRPTKWRAEGPDDLILLEQGTLLVGEFSLVVQE